MKDEAESWAKSLRRYPQRQPWMKRQSFAVAALARRITLADHLTNTVAAVKQCCW